MNLRVTDRKYQYIQNLFAKDDKTLEEVRNSIDEKQKHMCLSSSEAKILEILIQLGNCKKIIEVGTLSGYTSIRLARAAGKDAKVFTLEKSPENFANAKKNIGSSDVANNITVIEGPANESLKSIESQGPFDAIFIDADKSGYPAYLTWAESNIRKGGLIIGDNTFLFGQVYEEEISDKNKSMVAAMNDFNTRLADSSKYTSIIIPTEEGLTVAIKNY